MPKTGGRALLSVRKTARTSHPNSLQALCGEVGERVALYVSPLSSISLSRAEEDPNSEPYRAGVRKNKPNVVWVLLDTKLKLNDLKKDAFFSAAALLSPILQTSWPPFGARSSSLDYFLAWVR